jgi:hypothetical protein
VTGGPVRPYIGALDPDTGRTPPSPTAPPHRRTPRNDDTIASDVTAEPQGPAGADPLGGPREEDSTSSRIYRYIMASQSVDPDVRVGEPALRHD